MRLLFLFIFNAWRLNENFAQLEWSVSRELNNAYFEIERRLDTDTGFVKVGQMRHHGAQRQHQYPAGLPLRTRTITTAGATTASRRWPAATGA